MNIFKFYVALLILALFAVGAAAPSATYTVNTTSDTTDVDTSDNVCADLGGKCSLRAAVMQANARPGADKIVLSNGVYNLTLFGGTENDAAGYDLDVTDDLTIEGISANATVIDAGSYASGDSRHFHVIGADLTLRDLRLRNGGFGLSTGGAIRADNFSETVTLEDVIIKDNEANSGGAIYVIGNLTLIDTIIENNTASSSGGGIFFNPANSGGVVTIEKSSIRGNNAINGGGLYVGAYTQQQPQVTITRSTFSGNTVTGDGGAISLKTDDTLVPVHIVNSTISGNSANGFGGGIADPSSAGGQQIKLYNATITGNRADANGSGAGIGGGIYDQDGSFFVQNSILAGNYQGAARGGFFAPDCFGWLSSGGYNVIGNESDCTVFAGNGDQIGTAQSPLNPLLNALGWNGGPTQTHSLQENSPAVNNGNPQGCKDPAGTVLGVDQRGYQRPKGFICDIGAFESSYELPTAVGELRGDAAAGGRIAVAITVVLLAGLVTATGALLRGDAEQRRRRLS